LLRSQSLRIALLLKRKKLIYWTVISFPCPLLMAITL
jgi:hypothetical protein